MRIVRAIPLVFLAACGGEGGGEPRLPCEADPADLPEPRAGRCEAVTLDESATLPAGPDGDGGFVIPGGQRVSAVGTTVRLTGFPMGGLAIPGTRLVAVTDGGKDDEVLSIVDVDRGEVVHREVFSEREDEALFLGLAASADGGTLWVSGGGSNVILAYDVDPASGALSPIDAGEITVADDLRDGFVSGLALRDDGLLAACLLFGDALLLWDTAEGREVARVPLESGAYPFAVVFSPDGSAAYASLWGDRAVAVVDVEAAEVVRTIPVGKNPEGLAISPDGERLVVASADSDSLSVVDLATDTVDLTYWIVGEEAPRGVSPVAVRFDAEGRLYVVNAFENAVDVMEPAGSTGFTRVGRIPALWHPTDVALFQDGTAVVVSGRGASTGPNVTPGDTDIMDLVGGALSVVDGAELTEAHLRDWEVEVDRNNGRMEGFSGVECAGDAAYDFPIPRPGEGPSEVIRHVVLVIRENKTYDAYMGCLTDESGEPLGNGDCAMTLLPADVVEDIIPNTWALARGFASGDNYYSHAEQSLQGHVWTTHGRTTDAVERTWLTTSGREYWLPQGGLTELGSPEEGSALDYLVRHDVTVANYGEIVGSLLASPEPGYPGLFYSYEPDIEKAGYVATQILEGCDMRTFTYVLLPNDHTMGLSPGERSPESMIADNDEGVGLLVDAISHSVYWPETVVFIVEDDPQTGGDHVENHRSPLLVVSPWARRGHVSSVNFDEASIYRTVQLILGLAEANSATWLHAAPLYDLFTSTPDYTPYEHVPRRWPETLNPDDDSHDALLSRSYDWSAPDEQPGLGRMLWRHFRGTEPPWPEGGDEEGD